MLSRPVYYVFAILSCPDPFDGYLWFISTEDQETSKGCTADKLTSTKSSIYLMYA
jgi:hypothetical protein